MDEVEGSVRCRARAGRGLALEERQHWDAALADYQAVAAARSSDAILRAWARLRAGAVKARLNNPALEARPSTASAARC